MRLKDVMTVDVQSVPPNCSVRGAAAKMAEFDICTLPVCEGRRILGQVTDRDITIKVTAEGMNPEEVTVSDIMTPAIWAREDMDVTKAAILMQNHQIRRLLVVNGNGELAGIVGVGDIALEADEMLTGGSFREISKTLFRH